jgi:Ca2+:H+ antiporter
MEPMQIGDPTDGLHEAPVVLKPGGGGENVDDLIKHPSGPTLASSTKAMLFGSSLNVLLVAVPFAFLSQGLSWPNSVTFIFALIAICPLAERLGFITEQLAMHTNETIGGLLNVTFGNATELIVALTAMFKGLYRVVQLTLLGSILSNMLLVLGCAFFFGGMKFREQKYGKITSQVNMSLLMLSVMGLLFPTVLVSSVEVSQTGDLGFSRCTSVIMLLMYCAFLYFQVRKTTYSRILGSC